MARWPATGTGRHQVADASWRDRSVAIAGASAAGNGVPHQESAWDSPYVATRRRTLRPVMRSDQRLTTGDVEAVAGQVLGRVVGARLLEERDRNQVFAVGEEAILKAYLRDGAAKQERKVATLRFLEGRGLPVPRLLGHGPAGAAAPRRPGAGPAGVGHLCRRRDAPVAGARRLRHQQRRARPGH